MLNLAEALQMGLQHHQAGNLHQAEQLYRQILHSYPDNADTYHLLGAVAHQTGRHEQAIALMRQAVALNPAAAAYHSNLGLALGRSADWMTPGPVWRKQCGFNQICPKPI